MLFTFSVLVVVIADFVTPSRSIQAHAPGMLVLQAQLLLWIVARFRTRQLPRGRAVEQEPPMTSRQFVRTLVLFGAATSAALSIQVWRQTNGLQSVVVALLGGWALLSAPLLAVVLMAAISPRRVALVSREAATWGAIGDLAVGWVSWVVPSSEPELSGRGDADPGV